MEIIGTIRAQTLTNVQNIRVRQIKKKEFRVTNEYSMNSFRQSVMQI